MVKRTSWILSALLILALTAGSLLLISDHAVRKSKANAISSSSHTPTAQASSPATESARDSKTDAITPPTHKQPTEPTASAVTPGTNETTEPIPSPSDAAKEQEAVDRTALIRNGPGWGSSLASDAVISESNMLFLTVQLAGNKLDILSQVVVDSTMKLPPYVTPENGVYHRILSDSGKVLAHGITPNPRLLYWDVPAEDGSGNLTGGVIQQSNAVFIVRYPLLQNTNSTIEFFNVSDTDNVFRVNNKESNCYGSFKLEIPTR